MSTSEVLLILLTKRQTDKPLFRQIHIANTHTVRQTDKQCPFILIYCNADRQISNFRNIAILILKRVTHEEGYFKLGIIKWLMI